MSTWTKYTQYVEKHFRYMPCSGYAVGSVPICWDDEGLPSKFCAVTIKTYAGQDAKAKLKYGIAEKLPSFWALIPEEKK